MFSKLGETENSSPKPRHVALVACAFHGSLLVLETNSEYLTDWVLDGTDWMESDCAFYEQVGDPPEKTGIWLLEFEVDGSNWYDPETGHPEGEAWAELVEWRRPDPDTYEAIALGKAVLTEQERE